MNLREELYRSGAGLTVAHVYTKRGRRVPVLDPARRTKAAVLALLLSGLTPRQTARALDIPLATVCALGLRALEEKRIFSNLRVADMGNIP